MWLLPAEPGRLGQQRVRARQLRSSAPVLLLGHPDVTSLFVGACDQVLSCDDLADSQAVAAALSSIEDIPVRLRGETDWNWPALVTALAKIGLLDGVAEARTRARLKPVMRARLRDRFPLDHLVVECDHGDAGATSSDPEWIAGEEVVVKPIWGTGSAHVEVVESGGLGPALVRGFAGLREDRRASLVTFEGTRWDRQRTLLVEGFARGRQLSVEGFVSRGRVVVLGIQEKVVTGQDQGRPTELCNVYPTPYLDGEEHGVIDGYVREVVAELGLNDDFFHVEVTWDGQALAVIEVNPRRGGGSVAKMLAYWHALDPSAEAALWLGSPPEIAPVERSGFLVGCFLGAERCRTFTGYQGLEQVRAHPRWAFDHAYLMPGDTVSMDDEGAIPPSYGIDVFFVCFDVGEVEMMLNFVDSNLSLLFAN